MVTMTGGDILVREGIFPPETMRDNGGVVYPGRVVTRQGQTGTDVIMPTAISDSAFGIAGLLENADINEVYADDVDFPVHRCGSGARVKAVQLGGAGPVVAGDIMISAGDGSGKLMTLAKGLEAIAADVTTTVLATTMTHFFAIVGRAWETLASVATDEQLEVLLSI
jgi:hypothetical protein